MDIVEQTSSGTRRHPWELARLEILIQLVDKCIPKSDEVKTIADVGCGDCFFASQLLERRSDIRIIGIDTAYTEAQVINKVAEINHPGFFLFGDSRDALEFLHQEQVHLILFLDVIEHIEKDVCFLQETVNNFKSSQHARFLISVPAFHSLFTGHDVFLRHHRRYNVPSVRKVAEQAGLVPIDCGYFFISLLPIRLIQKIIERSGYRRQQKGIGSWSGSEFLSRLFKNYLLFDFKFSKLMGKVGIKLPCLSVYCICKKLAS